MVYDFFFEEYLVVQKNVRSTLSAFVYRLQEEMQHHAVYPTFQTGINENGSPTKNHWRMSRSRHDA